MDYRFAAALAVAFSAVFTTFSQAATVGVTVGGFGSAAQVGTTENRSALGGNAIKYYIPLGGSSCTYGVAGCGTTSDSGKGGPTLSMWMMFDGVSTTSRSQLSVFFEDLDLINANDPWWFLETAQIFRSDGTSLTGLLSDIRQIVPGGALSGNQATQQLLTLDLGILPSDKFWLRFDFTANSRYKAGNTSEFLIASVATVPLPAAGWLMLSALGGLGAMSRSRKRKSRA